MICTLPAPQSHYVPSQQYRGNLSIVSNGLTLLPGKRREKVNISNLLSPLPCTQLMPPIGETLDTDDPEHITWLFQKALARAKEFNIPGVTYSLTQGVVKNIIPAIASTNAIIAASCCNEAFKIATSTNPYLNNYMMYSGDDGVYTYTFEHQRKPDCPVCGNLAKELEVDGNSTLREFIERLAERAEAYVSSFLVLT